MRHIKQKKEIKKKMNTGVLTHLSKKVLYTDIRASLGVKLVSNEHYKEFMACHKDKAKYPVEVTFEDIHLLFTARHESLPGGYFAISYKMIEKWGIDAEVLHMDALQIMSEREPAECAPIRDIMAWLFDINKQTDVTNDIDEPLLLYTQKQNGAAAVFYPDQLKKIAKKHQCNLYIAFTSQHETILYRTVGKNEILERRICKKLSEVSHDVYGEKVSDSVYYYDLETDTLAKC